MQYIKYTENLTYEPHTNNAGKTHSSIKTGKSKHNPWFVMIDVDEIYLNRATDSPGKFS